MTSASPTDRSPSASIASARRCDSLGVQPEQRVALILQDTPAFAYSFFGAIKAGLVPVPLNTLWRAKDYSHALSDSGARVLVISEALLREFEAIDRAQLPRLEHVIVVGQPRPAHFDFDRLLAESSPALDAEPTHRDAMAFWLYSSGSTGGPKGCVHLQHDMFVCAESYAKGVLGMRESRSLLQRGQAVLRLRPRQRVVYAVRRRRHGDPAAGSADGAARLRDHRALQADAVVQRADQLRHAARRTRAISISRASATRCRPARRLPESLFRRFKERFGVEILDAIGSTECLHMFIANRPGDVRPGSSGQLIPGYEARIVDDHDQPVAVGEMGNLLIKGDSTCAYYWNQHEKTKQTIQGEWIRTGDKYYRDADGYYWYGGRSDDMLKAGGIWVSPVEIESVLIDHEAVQECAVIGRDDGDGLSKPFAYVVLKAQVTGTPELAAALQTFVRERLAEYKRPRGVEFVPELPKTATGKLQRFKLRAKWGSGADF